MKKIMIQVISTFNILWLKLLYRNGSFFRGVFFSVRVKMAKNNIIQLIGGENLRVRFSVKGSDNFILNKKAHISNSDITIIGNGNQLIINDEVKLRAATIIIRGSHCKVEIGRGTTFGGIRIVNAGKNNNIIIGEYCLFSDFIELWGSDTHPIFDVDDNIINQERPILIGNNVWVGSRVIILKGVTINDGSIIGMGSVVTKSVPSKVISAGYPNRTIKECVSWRID